MTKDQQVEIEEVPEVKKQQRKKSKRNAWFRKLGLVRKYAHGEKSFVIRNYVKRVTERVLEGRRLSRGARETIYLATMHVVDQKLGRLYDDFVHNERLTVYPQDIEFASNGTPKPRDSFFATVADFHGAGYQSKLAMLKNRPA